MPRKPSSTCRWRASASRSSPACMPSRCGACARTASRRARRCWRAHANSSRTARIRRPCSTSSRIRSPIGCCMRLPRRCAWPRCRVTPTWCARSRSSSRPKIRSPATRRCPSDAPSAPPPRFDRKFSRTSGPLRQIFIDTDRRMTPALRRKLEALVERREELERLLADPGVVGDNERFRTLSREFAQLEPVAHAFAEEARARRDLAAAEAMRADPELRALADEEIAATQARLVELETELMAELVPKDPRDEGNVYLEVRAGTGGDEAAIFAGDLFRMYARYAERQGWKVEVESASPGEHGGYKEIVARIEGRGVYSRLKFESGTHRVQRVPATESQGRIHTSACTVAILPDLEEVTSVDINPADVRVDTFRASGAGGQHVNKTDSAVRLTHLPSGIVVECQDARSQHKNREQAWRILAARIKDKQTREAAAKEASERKSLIGSGDRSDRIRTYNFPQGRVTDHRINLTLHKIDSIMDGDLADLTSALAAEHQAEQLASLAQNG